MKTSKYFSIFLLLACIIVSLFVSDWMSVGSKYFFFSKEGLENIQDPTILETGATGETGETGETAQDDTGVPYYKYSSDHSEAQAKANIFSDPSTNIAQVIAAQNIAQAGAQSAGIIGASIADKAGNRSSDLIGQVKSHRHKGRQKIKAYPICVKDT